MSTTLKTQFRWPPISKNFNVLAACPHSLAVIDTEWSPIWIHFPFYRCYLTRQNSQATCKQ